MTTAVKDGIEDYRRTVLDNELNNTAVHLLVGLENRNVTDDHISMWRRIKKATSRGIRYLVKQYKKQMHKKRKGKDAPEIGNDLERTTTRASIYTVASASESIQMTPVNSPNSAKRFSFVDGVPMDVSERSQHLEVPESSAHVKPKPGGASRGSVIDPSRSAQGVAKFKQDYWKNVRVGDFVRIYNDEEIPADIIILSTSDIDGACYVETKNLDGETNLKVRNALLCSRAIRHSRDCEVATFMINSELPHANLYRYSGIVQWMQKDPKAPEKVGAQMEEPVSINNLLLRGCTLRNTDWIIGVVAFTGDETKIMMNAGITPSKRSRITRELNWNVSLTFYIYIYIYIYVYVNCPIIP